MDSRSTTGSCPGGSSLRLDFKVNPGNKRELELWQFALSPMHAMDLPDRSARPSFKVDMTSYQFADIATALGSSSAARFERTTQAIARSGLDNICVLTHLAGGFELNVDGRSVEVQPGDTCFLDLARQSMLRTPDYTSLAAIMLRALLAPLVKDIDALHGMVLKKGSPLAAMLGQHLHTLFREAPALDATEARIAARGTAALVATFAEAHARKGQTATRTDDVASLRMLRNAIEKNIGNPNLGPELLCLHAGLSRATLYRLFEPVGGVREYIQQRRLTRAYQMLTDPAHSHDRVSAIANSCGFSNDSAFSRAFREAYGMPPSALRNTAGESRPSAHQAIEAESSFVTMNRWLMGLGLAGR